MINYEQIGKIMKRIGASYEYWYNWKNEWIVHVFQDRYKSECVEDVLIMLVKNKIILEEQCLIGLSR